MSRQGHPKPRRPVVPARLKLWLFDFTFLGQHLGHLAPGALLITALLVIAVAGRDSNDGPLSDAIQLCAVAAIVLSVIWALAQRAGLAYFRTLVLHDDPARCAGCGYDLSHRPGETCPECGQRLESLRNEVREAYGSARRE